MNVLDDPDSYLLDASGMFAHIERLGAELMRAWKQSETLRLPARFEPAALIISAMGGSAAAADYFTALAEPVSAIPVSVVRDYHLPARVSAGTLVVVLSYSGTTEEALSCYEQAKAAGAQIATVSNGAELRERAKRDGFRWHPIAYESAPRAALGHALAPLLRWGQELGLIELSEADLAVAAASHKAVVSREIGAAIPARNNRAKQIAADIQGKFALLFAGEHLEAPARRMKNQFAENAEVLASFEPVPEGTHNVVVPFEDARIAANTAAILFESPLFGERMERRAEVLSRLCADSGLAVHRIRLSGTSLLGDMLEATAWGDYISCYLALLRGVDPTPTLNLDRVREAMSDRALAGIPATQI